jgi:hypothetical protein
MAEKRGSAFYPKTGLPKIADYFYTSGATSTYIERNFDYQAIGKGGSFTTEPVFKAFPQNDHVKWTLIVFVICIHFFVLS